MAGGTTGHESAEQARNRLAGVLEERRAALHTPLAANAAYMADLEADIAVLHAAYVVAAVTELAVRRGARHGRLRG